MDIFDLQMLPNRVAKLEEHDVHVWAVNRSIYDELKNYSDYFLNEDEQNRAKRFRHQKDHDLFVIGRSFTKVLLAYYTESTPDKVAILPDSFGKPTCELNVYFNISHSDNQLLLGFSNSEIGVDIEKKDAKTDIEKIGERHFSATEFQKMMSFSGDERTESFFDIWTKKEALIKGIGKGLSIPLQDFNVTHPTGKVLWKFPAEKEHGNWYVQNIEAKKGFKSAFATQNEVVAITYFSQENE